MINDNNKQRTFGIILQYTQMALNIVISLFFTPVMLRILGKVEYGIYSVSASVISYLNLLSLGFGGSYLRFYSVYKRDDDKPAIRRMNGLYLIVFILMGALALVGGLFLAGNAQIFFNETYTDAEIRTAKVLMTFLAVNLAVSFPASVFTSYVISQEKFIFQKLLNIGKTVIGPAVNIILLYAGYGSVGMVVCTTVLSFVIDVVNVCYCFGKLDMEVSFKHPDFKLLKDIFVFSLFIALNQIIDEINWQTDKVILGKMINGGAVAVYEIGAQINQMYISFSTAISGVFAPEVNRIVQENAADMDDRLTQLFIRVGRIQWFVLSLILMGFIFFGQFFILKWAGAGYENAYWVALLLITPVIVPLTQNIGLEIQRAKNKHQFRSFVYLFMAVLNVGISICLVSMWGEIGAAVGTTISVVLANGLIMNIYYHKKLGIDIIAFWKSIGQTLPGMILPIVCGVCLLRLYRFRGLQDFILLIIAYTAVYAVSVYFFALNKEEKQAIQNTARKIFRRKSY